MRFLLLIAVFGTTIATNADLNSDINGLFSESDITRTDHALAAAGEENLKTLLDVGEVDEVGKFLESRRKSRVSAIDCFWLITYVGVSESYEAVEPYLENTENELWIWALLAAASCYRPDNERGAKIYDLIRENEKKVATGAAEIYRSDFENVRDMYIWWFGSARLEKIASLGLCELTVRERKGITEEVIESGNRISGYGLLRGLGRTKDPSNVAIVELFYDNPDPSLRAAAYACNIGFETTDVLPGLRKAYEKGDVKRRLTIINLLSRRRFEPFTEQLNEWLMEDVDIENGYINLPESGEVIRAEYGGMEWSETIEGDSELVLRSRIIKELNSRHYLNTDFNKMLLKREEPILTIIAAKYVPAVGDEGTLELVAEIALNADDHDYEAVTYLRKFGDEAVPYLYEILDSGGFSKRFTAMSELSRINPPGFIEKLIGIIEDPDDGLSNRAYETLSKLDPEKAAELTGEYLSRPKTTYPDTMETYKINPEETRKKALSLLESNDVDEVRLGIWTLVNEKDPADLPVIAGAIDRLIILDKFKAREMVADLRVYGDAALPYLIEYSKHNEPEIRDGAASGLFGIETEEATEILESMLYDPERNVRDQVMLYVAYRKPNDMEFIDTILALIYNAEPAIDRRLINDTGRDLLHAIRSWDRGIIIQTALELAEYGRLNGLDSLELTAYRTIADIDFGTAEPYLVDMRERLPPGDSGRDSIDKIIRRNKPYELVDLIRDLRSNDPKRIKEVIDSSGRFNVTDFGLYRPGMRRALLDLLHSPDKNIREVVLKEDCFYIYYGYDPDLLADIWDELPPEGRLKVASFYFRRGIRGTAKYFVKALEDDSVDLNTKLYYVYDYARGEGPNALPLLYEIKDRCNEPFDIQRIERAIEEAEKPRRVYINTFKLAIY
jgi:hypothetical protein